MSRKTPTATKGSLPARVEINNYQRSILKEALPEDDRVFEHSRCALSWVQAEWGWPMELLDEHRIGGTLSCWSCDGVGSSGGNWGEGGLCGMRL
jgi:hypothetical protein